MSDDLNLDPVLQQLAVTTGKHVAATVRLATVRAAANLADPKTYPLPDEKDSLEVELSGLLSKMPPGRKKKLVADAITEMEAPYEEREQYYGPVANVDFKNKVPTAKQAEKLLKVDVPDLGARLGFKSIPQQLSNNLQKKLGQNRWNGVRFFIESVLCRRTSGMGFINDRVEVAGVAIDPSKFTHMPHAMGDQRVDTTPGIQTISDYIGSMGSDDRLPGGVEALISFTPLAPTAGQPFATWPRKYTVVMSLVVEASSSEEVENIAKKILDKASGAAASAVTNALAATVGAALGSPGGLVGMALGALIGAAVGAALGALVDFIKSFFDTHVSPPVTYELEIPATLGYPPGFTPVSDYTSMSVVKERRVTVNRGDYIVSTYWDMTGFTPPPPIVVPVPTTSSLKELGNLEPALALACWDDHIYALMGDGRLLVRRADKHALAWESIGTMDSLRSLAALNGRLYASTKDGKLLTRTATPASADWTVAGDCPDTTSLAAFRDTSLYSLASDGALRLADISSGAPSWGLVGAAIGARTLGVSWRGSGAKGWGIFTAIEENGAPPKLAFKVGEALNSGWEIVELTLSGVASLTATTFSNNSGAIYFSSDDGILRMYPTSRIT